jgi:hypothetical protein
VGVYVGSTAPCIRSPEEVLVDLVQLDKYRMLFRVHLDPVFVTFSGCFILVLLCGCVVRAVMSELIKSRTQLC